MLRMHREVEERRDLAEELQLWEVLEHQAQDPTRVLAVAEGEEEQRPEEPLAALESLVQGAEAEVRTRTQHLP